MTRRKLGRMKVRPPDEDTVLRYLIRMSGWQTHHELESLPEITSASLFDNHHPLELEIGCGSGEFIIALAVNNPSVNFIGLDLHTKSLHKAVEAAADKGLENIKFIAADFRFLSPLLVAGSLQAIYLHFPDPGMKRRLRKQRIFGSRFPDEMYCALVSGGRLSVVSDHERYFSEMLSIVAGDGRWGRTHEELYLTGFEPPVKSRFQRLWESRGRIPRRFELVKLKTEGLIDSAPGRGGWTRVV